MGGHAFETDGLSTPRISTELYEHLKQQYAAVLARFYSTTEYAEEIPGKLDHGDIDILVEGPLDNAPPSLISTALGAKADKRNGAVTSYAIPHPGLPDAHVQLDVQVCPPGHLSWQRFQTAYGDLVQILGVAHRNLGLVCTDKGLHVRIPDIEPVNKKASLIHLTHDPTAAMDFLGLDAAGYYADGFASEEEAFAWIARGRFFSRANVVTRDGGPARPEGEKHNDRARRQKRGMYRRFVDDWMAAHPDVGADCAWSREQVLHAALGAFDRQREYDERLARHREHRREDALWTAIKDVVPRRGSSLGIIVRGLKRWVRVRAGVPTLCDEPLPSASAESSLWVADMAEGGEAALLDWVSRNWEAVQVKEKAWANARKMGAAPAALCNGIAPPPPEEN